MNLTVLSYVAVAWLAVGALVARRISPRFLLLALSGLAAIVLWPVTALLLLARTRRSRAPAGSVR